MGHGVVCAVVGAGETRCGVCSSGCNALITVVFVMCAGIVEEQWIIPTCVLEIIILYSSSVHCCTRHCNCITLCLLICVLHNVHAYNTGLLYALYCIAEDLTL